MATRRERVLLELEDRFSAGIARAAVAAAALDKSLDRLGGTNRNVTRDLDKSTTSVERLGSSSGRAGRDIDRFSGRLRLWTDAAMVLGPALVPLGAVTIPLLTGAIAGLGAAAGGIGVTIAAFNGLGDALKAIDKAQLEPTTENLAAMRLELDKLGPAGAQFARYLDSLEPQLAALQQTAREGLFPGLEEGIDDLLKRGPQVQRIIQQLSEGMGGLAAEAGDSLSSEAWTPFFDYVEHTARPTMEQFGRATGNVALGLANMMVAFAPLTGDFTRGLAEAAQSFAEWSEGLARTQGFADFSNYVRETGPQLVATFEAIGGAILQIVEAASPLGGPVLRSLEVLANILGAIADSDIGTPIFAGLAALSLYNRAASVTRSLNESTWGAKSVASVKGFGAALTTVTTAQERAATAAGKLTARQTALRSGFGTLAKGTAVVGGLALASSGAADSLGLANTASLALMGAWAGPAGAAVGGAIGLTMDLAAANDSLTDSLARVEAAVPDLNPTNASLQNFSALITQAQRDIDSFQQASAAASDAGLLDQLTNPGRQLGAAKNAVEGLFGKSDVEEAQQALDGYRATLALLQGDVSSTTSAVLDMFGIVVPSSSAGERAMQGVAAAAQYEASSIEESIAAMRARRAELLRGVNAHLDYKAALLDARDALKDNGRTVDENTRAGQANLRALYAMPAAWNAQSDAVKNAKGAVQSARANFVQMATAMGMGEDKAKALAKRLYEIPGRVQTNIEVNTTDAMRKAAAIKKELASIDRNIDIYTRLHISRLPSASGLGPQVGSADGTTVPGPRYPYGDKMLYLLAPGEEVISNRHGQADRHRQLLKAINANRMAGGGTTGGARAFTSDYGPMISPAQQAALALLELKRHLKDVSAELDKQKARRDALRQQAAEVSSGISSGLTGDIWGGAANPWAAGAMRYDPIGQLNAQRDRARRLIAAINSLRAKGIKGGALAEIISTGDVERAEYMASLPSDVLGAYTTAYSEAQTAINQAAQAGGQATYGGAADALTPGINRLNATVNRLEKRLEQMSEEHKHENKKNSDDNADKVGAHVNGAAGAGHKRGRK